MAKLFHRYAVAALLCLYVGPFCSAQEAIGWVTDLRSAFQTAARERKLVLLHFYSDDCRPCKSLERNVFSQPEVGEAIRRNYVPVKVNANSSPDLVKRYNVEAWPTDVMVTAAGLEVSRAVSPQSPANYIQFVNQVALQAGVGAGRLAADPTLPQAGGSSSLYADVALTAGSSPMPPQAASPTARPGAGSIPSYDLAGGSPRADSRALGNPYVQQPPSDHRNQPLAYGRNAPPTPPANGHAAADVESTSIYGSAAAPAPRSAVPGDPQLPPRGTPAPRAALPNANGASAWPPSARQQAAHARPQAGPGASRQEGRAMSHWSPLREIEQSKAPPVAMEGFCPVTILEAGKWHKGNPRFGAVHRSRTYLFASQEAQQRFLADPDRYAPVLDGGDPVLFLETGKWFEGNHNIGVVMGQRTIFFVSPQTRARFEQSPQTYLGPALQAGAAVHR
jgi:YHS domain-containing protein